MADIPAKAIDSFGATGGILGLVILGLLAFMVWYIHSSHKHRSTENAALAVERKEWREAIEKNTAAFHSLEKALNTKPCLRPPDARTRVTDRIHRRE